jgi:hypothetical protein
VRQLAVRDGPRKDAWQDAARIHVPDLHALVVHATTEEVMSIVGKRQSSDARLVRLRGPLFRKVVGTRSLLPWLWWLSVGLPLFLRLLPPLLVPVTVIWTIGRSYPAIILFTVSCRRMIGIQWSIAQPSVTTSLANIPDAYRGVSSAATGQDVWRDWGPSQSCDTPLSMSCEFVGGRTRPNVHQGDMGRFQRGDRHKVRHVWRGFNFTQDGRPCRRCCCRFDCCTETGGHTCGRRTSQLRRRQGVDLQDGGEGVGVPETESARDVTGQEYATVGGIPPGAGDGSDQSHAVVSSATVTIVHVVAFQRQKGGCLGNGFVRGNSFHFPVAAIVVVADISAGISIG